MSRFLKPSLRDVHRIDSADIRGDFVRLDRNERVEPLAADEENLLREAVRGTHFISYPDPRPLQQMVAAQSDLPESCVLLTNGSDAAIRRLLHACLVPGDVLLVTDPTYEMYAIYGKIFEAEVSRIPYPSSRRLAIGDFIGALNDLRPKVLCIANPDQPTGNRLALHDLCRLTEAARESGTLLLVDEAYRVPGEPSIAARIMDYDNVAVVRSFSKVYGFGGIRLGILLGSPCIVEAATKVKGLHEVNTLALALGMAVLEHPEFLERYQLALAEGKEVLRTFARDRNLGFPECPSAFQLIELPDMIDPGRVVEALRMRGWLVKGGFKAPCMRNALRVSLAGPQIVGSFVASFGDVLSDMLGG